jgi:hypothetical protein
MYLQTAIAQDSYPARNDRREGRPAALTASGSLLLRRCPVKHAINLVIDRLDAH